jgi:hypothetical protein
MQLLTTYRIFYALSIMLVQNTIKHSSGEILTGKLWRQGHPFLKDLPFYSTLPRMDAMGEFLEDALGQSSASDRYKASLVVCNHLVPSLDLITCLTEICKWP